MSLTTRRLMQKIKEETAAAENVLAAKTGLTIPLNVDESSFPDDEDVLNDFMVHKIYGLTSVVDALTIITADNLGKEAVSDEIKNIKLINTAKSFKDKGSKSVKLVDGELQISCAFSEGSDNLYRPEELAKAIERLL